MSCLVIKNDGIGDLILASGLISGLAVTHGPVDLVTCVQNREVAELIPGIRRVHYVSRDGLQFRRFPLKLGLHWTKIPLADHEPIAAMREENYGVAICLRRYIRASSLILMSRVLANRRLCCWVYPTNASQNTARHFSRGWEHFQGSPVSHEMTYYADFLKATLGVNLSPQPNLKVTPLSVGRLLNPGIGGAIGLSVGGGVDRWPAANWLELAQALKRAGYEISIFGGADCVGLGAQIAEACPGAVDLTGHLSLADSVSHLEKLSLLISNDTGFAHFASLVTGRVMIIMGGGGYKRFIPWPMAQNQFLIYSAVECYDCDWHCKLPKKECLTSIQPGQILDYAAELIQNPKPAPARNVGRSGVAYQIAWRREGDFGSGRIN